MQLLWLNVELVQPTLCVWASLAHKMSVAAVLFLAMPKKQKTPGEYYVRVTVSFWPFPACSLIIRLWLLCFQYWFLWSNWKRKVGSRIISFTCQHESLKYPTVQGGIKYSKITLGTSCLSLSAEANLGLLLLQSPRDTHNQTPIWAK